MYFDNVEFSDDPLSEFEIRWNKLQACKDLDAMLYSPDHSPSPAPGKPSSTNKLEESKKSKKIAEYLIKGQLEEREEKAIEKYQKNNARPDVYIGFGFEYDLGVIDFMQNDGTTKKIFALKVIKIGNPSRLPDDIKEGE